MVRPQRRRSPRDEGIWSFADFPFHRDGTTGEFLHIYQCPNHPRELGNCRNLMFYAAGKLRQRATFEIAVSTRDPDLRTGRPIMLVLAPNGNLFQSASPAYLRRTTSVFIFALLASPVSIRAPHTCTGRLRPCQQAEPQDFITTFPRT